MNYRIILIDDDPVALYLYAEIIKETGYKEEIITFDGVLKAVAFLDSIEGDTHYIILVDLNMPVLSGWDFLSQVSSHPQKHLMHVFILTSSVNQADKVKSLQYDTVAGFFEKPLEEEYLKQIADIVGM